MITYNFQLIPLFLWLLKCNNNSQNNLSKLNQQTWCKKRYAWNQIIYNLGIIRNKSKNNISLHFKKLKENERANGLSNLMHS